LLELSETARLPRSPNRDLAKTRNNAKNEMIVAMSSGRRLTYSPVAVQLVMLDIGI
jgi:hypothetical protein